MKYLEFEKEDNIGLLTFKRPEVLNTLNYDALREIGKFLDNVTEINALIVTGSGERAFAAGADIKEMQTLDSRQILQFARYGQEIVHKFEEVPFITIAAVNGFALGGGLEIALGCDFIYASDKAKLALPEIKLGIIPGWGGVRRLAEAVGKRRASELIMTGKMIHADEALQIGLVNRVCPSERLIAECREAAQKMLQYSPFALRQIKQILSSDTDEEYDAKRFAECFETDEAKRDIEKFLAKA